MTVAKVDIGKDDTTPWLTSNTIRVTELLIYITDAVVQYGTSPSIYQSHPREKKKTEDSKL